MADGIDGMQVHRFHWVARTGAETLDRESDRNGRAFLKTTDGATVPVSRANVSKVGVWLGWTLLSGFQLRSRRSVRRDC